MALCNLLTHIVFTTWTSMQPHLLSADTVDDSAGRMRRSYGYGRELQMGILVML
ncbi:hypothetical protein BKA65DRAFT_506868 [Rhexocercosporidium sp. MPI-PUGE-AT-0058]|nr:hypothetical protein BKA65DRAFT_506868 [Rhexocercosporidium sp. MPI-PUGE-AT-0058]